MDKIITEIRALKPDFIVNSLIGESSYAFLAALADIRAGMTGVDPLPVFSCNFTEGEIAAAGRAADGLYAAGPYFETGGGRLGSFAEMSRLAVLELAKYLHGNPGAETLHLTELLSLAAHQGRVSRLDGENQHARQSVVIAQLRGGQFHEIVRLPERAADPYWTRRCNQALQQSPLRVVS